jgi:hypothetical protein
MTVSPQDAAAALRDIDAAQARSKTLRGYQHAAPHFLIWGIVWVVGYGLSDVFRGHANAIWGALVPIGLVAGVMVKRDASRAVSWRYAAMGLAILSFCGATFFVMWPVSGRQISAFIPLVIALLYVLGGIWAGPRYAVTGVAVAVLTLVGFVWLSTHFLLWMAFVGGGALILAGLWLRKA